MLHLLLYDDAQDVKRLQKHYAKAYSKSLSPGKALLETTTDGVPQELRPSARQLKNMSELYVG